MANYSGLKKCSMAFQLKDGNILLIDKEDINEIATKIIVEGSLNKTCVILRESNKNMEKANMLFNILKSEGNAVVIKDEK